MTGFLSKQAGMKVQATRELKCPEIVVTAKTQLACWADASPHRKAVRLFLLDSPAA
ncbi:hypothetical protein AB0C90_34110 [Streptomyces sp. NPDC048550]|uniref:hypothetical protein n=1 Tax=unclassified Streptomyces TaxID=2593676 RepID=UPI00342BF967